MPKIAVLQSKPGCMVALQHKMAIRNSMYIHIYIHISYHMMKYDEIYNNVTMCNQLQKIRSFNVSHENSKYFTIYTSIYIQPNTERKSKVVCTTLQQPEFLRNDVDTVNTSENGFVLVSIDFQIHNPPCGSCQKKWELKAISQNANAQSQHSKPMYTNSKRLLRDVTSLR